MADICGTGGNDCLPGTSADDRIFGMTGDGKGSGGTVVMDFENGILAAASGDKLVFQGGVLESGFEYGGAGNSQARFAGPTQMQVDSDGDAAIAFRIESLSSNGHLTATDFPVLWQAFSIWPALR